MDTPAIEARDLCKQRCTPSGIGKRALDGFSLTVPRGECFGLAGPGSAGKTTFAAIAAGMMRADSGHIRVFGELPAVARAGLLASAGSSHRLLEFLKRAAGGESPVATSSAGWLARAVGLVKAPAAPPNLLILDEVAGLDHSALSEAHRLIRQMTSRGMTILVCSRFAAQLARLCDSVAIVRAGKVVASGKTAELLGARGFRLTVVHLSDDLQEALARDGMTIGFNGDYYWIESPDRARLGGAIDRIRLSGGSIESLEDLPVF